MHAWLSGPWLGRLSSLYMVNIVPLNAHNGYRSYTRTHTFCFALRFRLKWQRWASIYSDGGGAHTTLTRAIMANIVNWVIGSHWFFSSPSGRDHCGVMSHRPGGYKGHTSHEEPWLYMQIHINLYIHWLIDWLMCTLLLPLIGSPNCLQLTLRHWLCQYTSH